MRFKYLLLTTILFASLVGCNLKREGDTPTITVTIEPLKYFTEAIAGDHFIVHSMVPKGTSPETYDPTPQQLVALANSLAYFKIGYIGFELSWMDKIKENNNNLKVFDTSEGINLIQAESHWHGDHEHKGGIEPHTWNSTINAKIIADNILEALIALDAANSDYYKNRHKSLLVEIDKTDKAIVNLLSGEKVQSGFMIYHPALSYFARDYNLNQVSIEENGKEPTPAHLKELIIKAREQNIHTIFIQPEFDKKNAEVIAKETKSQIIAIYPLAYEWHEEMIKVAEALTR